MKKIKYIFLVIISLFASLDIIHAENIVKGSFTYINPEYRGIYREADFASFKPSVDLAGANEHFYESPEEVGLYLRSEILKGNYVVTISYKTPSIIDDVSPEIDRMIKKAKEHTGVPNAGDYLRSNSLDFDIDYLFYSWPQNGIYRYDITFTYKAFTTPAEEAELDAKIKEVLASLKLDGKTDYQKVSAIYDYITSHVTYDDESFEQEKKTKLPVLKAHSAYNALIKGTSVCQGYALLFYRMALEVGIDARYISGDANGSHAWNIVKLGNYYYNLDPTWDAGRKDYKYFLRSNENFTDHKRNNEYLTNEFNQKYPMSPDDYKEGAEIVKGDLNGDGEIGLTDVLMLLKVYFNNQTNQYTEVSDMNNDRKIDLTDVLILLKVYFTNN